VTTIDPVYSEFGTSLAFCERAMSSVLREHLAKRGIAPETWYALKLVATRGPALDREVLAADLAGARGLDSEAVAELFARLESEGVLTGAETVDLTPYGAQLFSELREYIAEPTSRLLNSFDRNDIETTVRTLKALTVLAAEG
jgi:DNA-binding MarR family transcriptional regulator